MSLFELLKKDKPLFTAYAALIIFCAALPFSVTAIQAGILLFIAVSLYLRRRDGAPVTLAAGIKGTPLFLPWLAYLGAGVLAAAFGVRPAASFADLNSDILTVVTFFGLCLFMKPGARDNALKAYLFTIAAAAVIGVYQALGGLASGLDIRAHAYAHPVRFGEIMVIGLTLALSLLSYPEMLSSRTKKLLFAVVLLIVSAVVLSQTRGAYLGMALAFASLLAARRPALRTMLPVIATAALLGLALAMLNPAVRYKLGSISKGVNSAINTDEKTEDTPINIRLELWKTGIRMIKDRPVFGGGPGSVKVLFPDYYPKPYPSDVVWGSLHNLYIHQTAERGLVGLAALLALFGGMFLVSLRNFRAAPSPFTLWALALMPAWFLMNMTEITFQHVHTSYAVMLSLAVSITAAKTK